MPMSGTRPWPLQHPRPRFCSMPASGSNLSHPGQCEGPGVLAGFGGASVTKHWVAEIVQLLVEELLSQARGEFYHPNPD